MSQIMPLFRERHLEEFKEKVRNQRREGKTKEEVLATIDRRVLTDEDVDAVYNEYMEENNQPQENVAENNNIDNQDNQSVENIEQQENNNEQFQNEQEEQNQNNFNNETNENINENLDEHQEEITNDNNQENIEDNNEQNEANENTVEENESNNEVESENIEGNNNQEENKEIEKEEIVYLTEEQLEDFPEQPFRLYDDEQKQDMIQSIKLNGIIQPLVVRPLENGKYQILSGHNRKYCGLEAGLDKFPCKIKYGLSDDEARLYLVDTNLVTRTDITPTERAKALLIRKSVYKSEQFKNLIAKAVLDDNLDQVDVRQKIQDVENMSSGNLQRYLRLNYLNDDLQKMTDEGRINLKTAEQLSFLNKDKQKIVSNMIEKDGVKINEGTAKKLREKNQELTKENIKDIVFKKSKVAEESEDDIITLKFTKSELANFFDNFEDLNVIKLRILEALRK